MDSLLLLFMDYYKLLLVAYSPLGVGLPVPGGCAIRVNTVSVIDGGDWGSVVDGGGGGGLILLCHHVDSVLDINPFFALAEGLTGCLIFTL